MKLVGRKRSRTKTTASKGFPDFIAGSNESGLLSKEANVAVICSTKLFLTKYEASDLLRISLSTLNRWLKEERITSVKIGGRVLIPTAMINKLASAESSEEVGA